MTIWKLTCPSGNIVTITFEPTPKIWRISEIKMNSPLFDNDEARCLSNMINSIIGRSNNPSIDLDFKFEIMKK
jgi:hypothetical protein